MAETSHRAVISVPANNTTMEPELNALLPELAPFAVARVKLPSGTLTLDDLPEYTRNTLDSIAPFLSKRLELVVHGCTAAGFLAGPAASARIIESMRVKSGAVVVGTGAAMADVLKHEGVRETAVVTPYLAAVNEGLRAYLASAGIAVEVVEHKRFGKDRDAFDRAVNAVLEAHRIDIVCLAGFMRVLTPAFVQQWSRRLINIHPSLLPAFKGLDTHARAIAAGGKTHGATVHFVAPELDSGPIIAQEIVPVLPGDTPDSLASRVLETEHRLYPLALKRVAEGLA